MAENTIMKLLILIVCIGTTLSTQVDNGCSPGWYQNSGYCYLFVNNKLVTQQQASDECDVFMATLLRIESADEQAFINSTVPQFTSDGFWTDMSQLRYDGTGGSTGVWQWGGYEPTDMSMIAWESYPTLNILDSCGAVNIQGNFQNWNCNRKLGYICEATQTATSGCFEGWLITKNACFWFSDTTDPTQLLSWNDARAQCASFPLPPGSNGTVKLVTLDDPADVTYIASEMPEVAKTTTMFWTGLKKNGKQWAWYNNDKYTPGYISWAKEPDAIDNNEHCAILKTDVRFSDQDCSKQMNYICRMQTDVENTDYYLGCNGWNRAGHKCYMFYDLPKTTWSDANSRCKSIGANLIKIENFDEKTWLEWQLTDESHSGLYWSGLNDQASEGVYRWADGSRSDSTLIKWNSEPNSFKGDEDCGVILVDGSYNDEDCYLHNPLICEYTNPQSTGCSNGWIAYTANHGCYYITPNNQTFTWSEAQTFCSKTMAQDSVVPTTLFAANNVNEMNFINGQLSKIETNPRGWWTGLNDQATEGIWVYPEKINNPVNFQAIQWNQQPKDPTGTNDCARLMWGGRYGSTNCNDKIGFICESYASGQSPSSSGRLSASAVLMFLVVLLARVLKTN